jgi:uncharacterized protein (DUF488 family)
MDSLLYTIGHSNHPIDLFLHLLAQNKIDVICDVRSSPYSKFNPQYNREALKENLNKSGVKYIFLGKELGARSNNPECYINNKVKYNLLAQEPIFQTGLTRLLEGIKKFRVAIMCAEKDPITCHRMILVCRNLKDQRVIINHVLENGHLESNSEAEARLLESLGIEPSLFIGQEKLLNEAYEIQGEKIAYELSAEKEVFV